MKFGNETGRMICTYCGREIQGEPQRRTGSDEPFCDWRCLESHCYHKLLTLLCVDHRELIRERIKKFLEG